MTSQTVSRPAFPAVGWFRVLRDAAVEDAELAVVGRWCTLDVALVVAQELVVLRLRRGRISSTLPAPDIGVSWDVTLRGTSGDWETFLQPTPPPLYTDLLAMNSRTPSFSIEGDRRKFVRHLRALGRLFAIAQTVGARGISTLLRARSISLLVSTTTPVRRRRPPRPPRPSPEPRARRWKESATSR